MNRKRGMIVAGMCAARRMSSRRKGSSGNPALWRPVTLHWRKTPRLRAPHRENPQAVSWTSIFAPQILQHFSSNLTALAHSTLFAAASSILKPLLTQRSSVVHHRETWRTCSFRERLFSQMSERHSSVERVDVIYAPQPRRGAGPASRPGPSPFPRSDRSLATTAHSEIRTTRVSNTFTSHAHHFVSSLRISVTPAVYPRESGPVASRYFVESPRIIHGPDMVWRQPPSGAKVESQDARRSALEAPQRSAVLTFDSPASNKTAVTTTPRSGAPSFDAAQMDRFVDTVIGRVDKRLRIERERRGR